MNSTAVELFRFLGTAISQDLKWDNHIESIVKKAQQRLYFLRQMRNSGGWSTQIKYLSENTDTYDKILLQ